MGREEKFGEGGAKVAIIKEGYLPLTGAVSDMWSLWTFTVSAHMCQGAKNFQ